MSVRSFPTACVCGQTPIETSYERQNFKRSLLKTGKKGDNQQKMIQKGCFCLAPIRVL